ncbi:MAG: glutamate--tRNA ligase [Nanoarchaeota archaeon]|nr:glutamate--tRNA ligase [Nanoarchaeota archaeon]MBU0977225.1 glutamate--tRNA ligase [Nanoarchaeota archaeon]
MKLEKEMRAYALKNAVEYGGAVVGKVLPKLFNHGLDKKDIGKIMPELTKIVNEVNKMSAVEREKEFRKFKDVIPEKEEKERDLPELENVSDKMVFRLAPYPSGALHIGNAKTYLLNALYAEKYKAKILLVMDDTIGSEEKQTTKEAYSLIEEGFKWLGVKYEKPVYYKSDRLEIYYNYAEELMKKGKAYVCFCSQEDFKNLKEKEKDCPHRKQSVRENLKLWKEMFGAKEGSMAVRIKTSMQHPNPAFRDRVLFRISDREHPRAGKKYRVWPTLEMSWAVDDHLLGVTHILRGNDLVMETEMEEFIWDIFGWKHATVNHAGLVRIEGMGAKISKSKAQKEVRSGEFLGWDDPRAWSLQSLRRRGFKPEAIREFIKEIGLNRQDISIPIEVLYSINRKLVDKEANRYFFVENPRKVKIEGIKGKTVVEMLLHPDESSRGVRKLNAGNEFFIGDKLEKNVNYRLMHLFNFKNEKFVSKEVDPKINAKMIHWLSVDDKNVRVRVLMEDGGWVLGLGEPDLGKISKKQIVQFERFGFAILDDKTENLLSFWFLHK